MSHVEITADSAGPVRLRSAARSAAAQPARALGLRLVTRGALSIRRRRAGKGWRYFREDDRPIEDEATIRRLNRLAVPPAYRDVLYARDLAAHLQAVGRDAAGRLQYRYHPDWEKVRELRKARHLERLAAVLPRIKRSIGQRLGSEDFSPAFTCSAVIELVAQTAIRAGNESYARARGTRGATTLLKSNIQMDGSLITLKFRAKGGKTIVKQFTCERLAAAFRRLMQLPGNRIFQYRSETGDTRRVSSSQVNVFLREIAETDISLKDFRTLMASASVLDTLCQLKPAKSERARRKQVMTAIRAAADELTNTPAICRKSYVHSTVVDAFEDGVLERFTDALKWSRSAQSRRLALAKIVSRSVTCT